MRAPPLAFAFALLPLVIPQRARAQESPPPPSAPAPVVAAPAASGQGEGDPGPTAGRWGLSLGFPTAGGVLLGGSYVLTEKTSIRLDFGMDAIFTDTPGRGFGFSLEGGYRWWFTKVGRLSPYLQPSLYFGKPAADTTWDQFTMAVTGALGAEFFFWREFSVSAQSGLALTMSNSFRQVRFGTGTTAAYANFYF